MSNDSQTPKFRQVRSKKLSVKQDKENMFMQLASKSLPFSEMFEKVKSNQKDIEISELVEKINKLDKENKNLRELLYKSNYHQLKKCEIQTSYMSERKVLDEHNVSLRLNFEKEEDSFEDVSFCTDSHSYRSEKKSQTPRMSLEAKKIHEERQRRLTVRSMTKEYLQESEIRIPQAQQQQSFEIAKLEKANCECVYKYSRDFLKDLISQVIKKDSQIFMMINDTIEKELSTKYKENVHCQMEQKEILSQLIGIIDRILDFDSFSPDKPFVQRSLNQQAQNFKEVQSIQDRMKLMLIPLNSMNNSQEERMKDLTRQNDLIEELNERVMKSSQIIYSLIDENRRLKQQVNSWREAFTNLNLQMESDPNTIIQSYCLEQSLKGSEVSYIDFDWSSKKSDQVGIDRDGGILMAQLNEIQRRYCEMRDKGIRNKIKFKNVLITIYNAIIQKSGQTQICEVFDDIKLMTFEEIENCILSLIKLKL